MKDFLLCFHFVLRKIPVHQYYMRTQSHKARQKMKLVRKFSFVFDDVRKKKLSKRKKKVKRKNIRELLGTGRQKRQNRTKDKDQITNSEDEGYMKTIPLP